MVEKSLTGVVTWLKQWFYDKDYVDNYKQDTLESGINIKTINGNSVLGDGNITIQGSGSGSSAIACVSDMGLDGTDLFLDACNGKVIESITKTTNGLVDTYTITYDDDSTYQFTVTNGSDATVTYTPTVTSSTSGAYKIGEINGTSIYGKDTDTHQSLANYIQKSSTSGLVKNDGTVMSSGTGASNWAVGNHTHSAYVNPTIADNLTTNDATQVLSAKQGKALADLIGSAISYINQ